MHYQEWPFFLPVNKKWFCQTFINGQFLDCPVIWVLNSNRSDKKISKLRVKYLWLPKWLHHKVWWPFEQTRVSKHSYKKDVEAYDWNFQISFRSIPIHLMRNTLHVEKYLIKMRFEWEHDVSSQSSCIVDLKLWSLKYSN